MGYGITHFVFFYTSFCAVGHTKSSSNCRRTPTKLRSLNTCSAASVVTRCHTVLSRFVKIDVTTVSFLPIRAMSRYQGGALLCELLTCGAQSSTRGFVSSSYVELNVPPEA